MALIDLEITHRERYADGREFGDVGPYIVEHGIATYAVDPAGPDGDSITDLRLAPVDDDGKIRFTGDVRLLRPFMTERATGVGLVDVVNRGTPLTEPYLNRFNRVPGEVAPPGPGDGWVFEQGWTVFDVGWQTDLIDHPIVHRLNAPHAVDADGSPLITRVTVELSPPAATSTVPIAAMGQTSRPPLALDDPGDELLRADHQHGPWELLSRNSWSFAREIDGELQPSGRHLHLSGGFEPGRFYAVRYRTNETPIVGAGLLVVRDAARWLRQAPGVETVVGFGVSQTGRFLRHLCSAGLNELDGFDGLHIHIGGARRGEFNDRHGVPGALFRPSPGHVAPFGSACFDPVRERQTMPKVVISNTSHEYWTYDASLCHTDLTGTVDQPDDPDVRIYHHAGAQHSVSGPGAGRTDPLTGVIAAHEVNPTDNRVLVRAEMIALVAWITEGTEPPPSCHPTIADGSLESRESALAKLAGHGLGGLDQATLPVTGPYDVGSEESDGVIDYPVTPAPGERYLSLVPTVGADGNEAGGVAVPSVAVPVAIHAGWNVREDLPILVPWKGLRRFFSEDELAGRYGDRAGYLEQVAAAADELIEQRRLLTGDRSIAIDAAATLWDAAVAESSRG